MQLSQPDLAFHEGGDDGVWTMVYDEGFEARVGGKRVSRTASRASSPLTLASTVLWVFGLRVALRWDRAQHLLADEHRVVARGGRERRRLHPRQPGRGAGPSARSGPHDPCISLMLTIFTHVQPAAAASPASFVEEASQSSPATPRGTRGSTPGRAPASDWEATQRPVKRVNVASKFTPRSSQKAGRRASHFPSAQPPCRGQFTR